MSGTYNYTYADMMLTIGGKVMIVIIVILILFFGSDSAQFSNADSVREFLASKPSNSVKPSVKASNSVKPSTPIKA